jgi:hypothetical protein
MRQMRRGESGDVRPVLEMRMVAPAALIRTRRCDANT